MNAHTPPKLAATLLKLFVRQDALIGDLDEQVANGRSRGWYWRQVIGIGVHDARFRRVALLWAIVGAVLLATAPAMGWVGTGRMTVPLILGITITSWGLWRFHRTSLAILYAAAVALMFPHWMMASTIEMSGSVRIFWIIARTLAGYGVIGLLLVPFLILRLGRSGPLAEPPTALSLTD